MLTSQQKAAYDFICEYYEDHKVGPSYREIMVALGLKSPSGAHRLVHALAERGFIDFLRNRARAIAPAGEVPSGSKPISGHREILKIVGDWEGRHISGAKALRRIRAISSGALE